MAVAVISGSGQKLMPTTERHAARLLRKGKAVIYRYRPVFTIRLTERMSGKTQQVEYASDTGYQHVGISIKSEKHEYVHAQYDMLIGEKERHDKCRKYRRTRRNRLRYRKARFNNRKASKPEGWLAPSFQHRVDNQIRLFEQYSAVIPVTTATFEMEKFDTQLLQAVADGTELPEGKDYQHGSRYLFQTERAAVFCRDDHTCQICGRSADDGAVLHTHHIGFWMNPPYRSNRIRNLLTVCDRCHTAKNHKPGGALWGIMPKATDLASATYMSSVRWHMYKRLVLTHPEIDIHIQYGAKTAVIRRERHIAKSHANDAYCIGKFRPNTAAKRNAKNTKFLTVKGKKYCLRDKVEYNGQIAWIAGFSGKTGCRIQSIDDKYLSQPGKSYTSINLSDVNVLNHNNNWIVGSIQEKSI